MGPTRGPIFHTRMAVVVPNLPVNSTIMTIIIGLVRVLETHGYHATLTFMQTDKPDINDLVTAAELADQLLPVTPLPEDIVDQLHERGIVVHDPLMSAYTEMFRAHALVRSHMARLQAERMIARGREKLVYVASEHTFSELLVQVSYASMINVCVSAGVKSPALMRISTQNDELAGELVNYLRNNPHVNGFICDNDHIALEIMQALRAIGKMVPSDAAVVGAGDTDECGLITPGLTSVGYENNVVTRILAEGLISTLTHKPYQEPSSEDIAPYFYIVARQSL